VGLIERRQTNIWIKSIFRYALLNQFNWLKWIDCSWWKSYN